MFVRKIARQVAQLNIVSRKVVGKHVPNNAEKYYGWQVFVRCSSAIDEDSIRVMRPRFPSRWNTVNSDQTKANYKLRMNAFRHYCVRFYIY